MPGLLPGKRLFLLSTGTGLAPFLSVIREPDSYDRFEEVTVVHGVRRVSDLAYHDMLAGKLAEDPLIADQAQAQFHYVPTVTREPFHTQGRITTLISEGRLCTPQLNPETDRIMLCGSMEMIRELAALLEEMGFEEGSNAKPGAYVLERAFVG